MKRRSVLREGGPIEWLRWWWPIAIVIGKLVWAGCVTTLVVGWWDLAVKQGR